jgi:hypothetical protein
MGKTNVLSLSEAWLASSNATRAGSGDGKFRLSSSSISLSPVFEGSGKFSNRVLFSSCGRKPRGKKKKKSKSLCCWGVSLTFSKQELEGTHPMTGSSVSGGLELVEPSSIETTNLNHCMCGSFSMVACKTFSAKVIYKRNRKKKTLNSWNI